MQQEFWFAPSPPLSSSAHCKWAWVIGVQNCLKASSLVYFRWDTTAECNRLQDTPEHLPCSLSSVKILFLVETSKPGSLWLKAHHKGLFWATQALHAHWHTEMCQELKFAGEEWMSPNSLEFWKLTSLQLDTKDFFFFNFLLLQEIWDC